MQVVNELSEAVEVDVVDGEVFVVLHVVDVVPLNVDRNAGGASLSGNLVKQKTPPTNFSAEIFDRVKGSSIVSKLASCLGFYSQDSPYEKGKESYCRFCALSILVS